MKDSTPTTRPTVQYPLNFPNHATQSVPTIRSARPASMNPPLILLSRDIRPKAIIKGHPKMAAIGIINSSKEWSLELFSMVSFSVVGEILSEI